MIAFRLNENEIRTDGITCVDHSEKSVADRIYSIFDFVGNFL
jgi:hypothetical protein